MSEFPTHPIVVTLPLAVYEALAALGEGDLVEEVAASLLADVVRLGTPGELHAAMRLAAQVADLQADRWEQRRSELAQMQAELQHIAERLGRLAAGV